MTKTMTKKMTKKISKIQAYLNSLDENITELNLSFKNLTIFPDLSRFTKLIKLICSWNQFTSLPDNLPNSL
jgi:hypothetical protein